jgi:hypothetical protein
MVVPHAAGWQDGLVLYSTVSIPSDGRSRRSVACTPCRLLCLFQWKPRAAGWETGELAWSSTTWQPTASHSHVGGGGCVDWYELNDDGDAPQRGAALMGLGWIVGRPNVAASRHRPDVTGRKAQCRSLGSLLHLPALIYSPPCPTPTHATPSSLPCPACKSRPHGSLCARASHFMPMSLARDAVRALSRDSSLSSEHLGRPSDHPTKRST